MDRFSEVLFGARWRVVWVTLATFLAAVGTGLLNPAMDWRQILGYALVTAFSGAFVSRGAEVVYDANRARKGEVRSADVGPPPLKTVYGTGRVVSTMKQPELVIDDMPPANRPGGV